MPSSPKKTTGSDPQKPWCASDWAKLLAAVATLIGVIFVGIKKLQPDKPTNEATATTGGIAIIGDRNNVGIPAAVHAEDMRIARNDSLQKQIAEKKRQYPRGAVIVSRVDTPNRFDATQPDARIQADWRKTRVNEVRGGRAMVELPEMVISVGNVQNFSVQSVGVGVIWENGSTTSLPFTLDGMSGLIEVIDTASATILVGFK